MHARHLGPKQRAMQMAASIRSLKQFERLARKRSTCPSSKRGGDLGTFERGRMVPAFEDVVWTTPLGSVSAPVKTEVGWHLIWVHARED